MESKTTNFIKVDQVRYDELVRKEEQLNIILRLIEAGCDVEALKVVVHE